MPSALSVPICDPTSRNGACNIRTSVERNAKQKIIAAATLIAIFTIVHRKSSKCSRNGLEVSLSGTSRNLKMSRSIIRSKSEIRISKQMRLEKQREDAVQTPRAHTKRKTHAAPISREALWECKASSHRFYEL